MALETGSVTRTVKGYFIDRILCLSAFPLKTSANKLFYHLLSDPPLYIVLLKILLHCYNILKFLTVQTI